MIERNVKFTTIIQIDVIEGKTFTDIQTLLDILIENSDVKISNGSIPRRSNLSTQSVTSDGAKPFASARAAFTAEPPATGIVSARARMAVACGSEC